MTRRSSINPNDPNALRQIIETIETGEGVRGDPHNRKITIGDLVKMGWIEAQSKFSSAFGAGMSSNLLSLPTSMPYIPDGFQGAGIIGGAMLFWDNPRYEGHSYTEIWRSSTDMLSSAVLIARDIGRSFTDRGTSEGATYYYWIRHVSKRDRAGPFQSANGLMINVPVSAESLLAELSGRISEAELTQVLAGKIAAADSAATVWAVQSKIGDINAGVGLFNNGSETAFAVAAQQFYIFDPDSPTNEFSVPFLVQDNKVYMNTAIIKDASIDEGKIGAITFGKLKDAQGNSITTVAGKLKADLMDVENITVGSAATFTGTAKSSNYVAGVYGWQLKPDGSFEANNAVFRGAIHSPIITGTNLRCGNGVSTSLYLPSGIEDIRYAFVAAGTESSSYSEIAGIVGKSYDGAGTGGYSAKGPALAGWSEESDGIRIWSSAPSTSATLNKAKAVAKLISNNGCAHIQMRGSIVQTDATKGSTKAPEQRIPYGDAGAICSMYNRDNHKNYLMHCYESTTDGRGKWQYVKMSSSWYGGDLFT